MHFFSQRQALYHSKSVLLIDDRKRQIFKVDLLLDHRMCTDYQCGFATGNAFEHLRAFFFLLATCEPCDAFAERRQQWLEPAYEFAEMLLRQDLGWRHERALPTVVDSDGSGQCGNYGFARSHIALQKAVHGNSGLDVAGYFFPHTRLRIR